MARRGKRQQAKAELDTQALKNHAVNRDFITRSPFVDIATSSYRCSDAVSQSLVNQILSTALSWIVVCQRVSGKVRVQGQVVSYTATH